MKSIKLLIFIVGLSGLLNMANIAGAQTADELRTKIDSHTSQIQKLKEEIREFQKQIDVKAAESQTLQNTIKTIDINSQKIGTEIKKTGLSIDKANLSIEDLKGQISDLESKIGANKQAIAESLKNVNNSDDISMIEIFLGSGSIAEAYDEYQTANSFELSVKERSKELSNLRDEITGKKTQVEGEKKNLMNLKNDLSDQNVVLANNKKEKNNLLTETKNKESEYKKILAEKQAQEAQFEKELFQFESQLKIAIDPSKYASAQKGVLAWPLDSVVVTQPFGRTVDSIRLYVSGTHNGVDFRASRGTRVLAALSGTVLATGNTDSQPGCYSYGKWILLKHDDGLSSLYGHLDLIKVSPGQAVSTGDVIGYSGQTGYATGPHLHFGLYASQGVRVERYTQSRNCKNVDVPVAPSNAYLDPMAYFPPL